MMTPLFGENVGGEGDFEEGDFEGEGEVRVGLEFQN